MCSPLCRNLLPFHHSHITHHSQPESIVSRDGWLLSAIQTDGVDFSVILVAPSAVKEQPKPKGGGSGNTRQSSLHDIDAVFDLPVAHVMDNGISNWEEGVMQAPALRDARPLKRIQQSVWEKLVEVSGTTGQHHKRLLALVSNDWSHDEAVADRRADERLVASSERDLASCQSKVAGFFEQVGVATDGDAKLKLEENLEAAKLVVESAKVRLKDAQKRAADSQKRSLPAKSDAGEILTLRKGLVGVAERTDNLFVLACLSFGEGAGPERFSYVPSERRPELVRIFRNVHTPL